MYVGLGLGLVIAVRWWGAGEGSGEEAQPPPQCMTVYAITDTKKGRTGIAPTYLQTTIIINYY